jgi:molybdenum cofactor guanylyltransferase
VAEHTPQPLRDVSGWVLSGGQGLRMGGQDKGLLDWQGHPMAWQVARSLAPQVSQVCVNANRHLETYVRWPWPVIPDDADLPIHSGPLVGILTGLRHCSTPWLQVLPCDGPTLPPDLVERLMNAAEQSQSDVAVPVTPAQGAEPERHHWTSALIRTRQSASLADTLHKGDLRVRHWITQQRWIGVSFPRADAFININAPETLHARR